MILYFSIATIIFWGAYTKNPRLFYLLGFFFIFLLSAFRDISLGGFDAANYERIFKETPNLFSITSEDLLSDYSIGYILFNSVIRIFSDDYRLFQFVYVVITMSLLFVTIEKIKISNKEKCILLFSYFCFRFIWYEWVLLRQNFANLLFWYNIVSYYNSNRTKSKVLYFCCSLILPPLFHTSAFVNILLLPAMFLLERRKYETKKYIIPVVSLGIYVASSVVVNYLFPYMVLLGGDRYDNYSESISSEMGNGNIVNYVLRFFFYFALIINYFGDKSKYRDFTLSTMIMVMLIGSVNFSSVNRMYEYYAIGLYLCQTSILRFYRNPVIRILYWAGMLIILGRFLTIGVEGTFLDYSMWILN